LVSRAQSDSPPSSPDPAQGQKQQARRRLIGAIALSLTAVVVLSVFFDAEPRRAGRDDVQVRIPARDVRLPERAGAEPAPAPAPEAARATEDRTAAAAPSPGPDSTTPPADAPPDRAEASSPRAEAVPAPAGKPDASAAKVESGDPRLETPALRPEPAARKIEPPLAKADAGGSKPAGATKGEPPAPKTEPAPAKALKPDAPAAARGPGHYLQVGAFASEKAASDQVERIRKLGHTAFTERIKTAQGERIRVRLGPYPSRDAADPVRGKLRAAGIDVTLIAP
jgi:DedD protein